MKPLALLFFLLASPIFAEEKTEIFNSASSQDGSIEIAVPDGWEKMDPDKDEEDIVRLKHKLDAAFIVARVDDMSDREGWNLEKYALVAMGKLAEDLGSLTVIYPKTIYVSGKSALQFELSGIGNGISCSYVITLIKQGNIYLKLITWATKSKFNNYSNAFRADFPKLIKPSSLEERITEAFLLGKKLGYDKSEIADALKKSIDDTLNFLRNEMNGKKSTDTKTGSDKL